MSGLLCPRFFLVWRGLLERGPNALRSLQEAQEETRMRARDGGGKRETVNRDARRFFYGKFETVCVIRFVSLGTAPPFRLSLFFCFSPRRKTHTTENWTFSVRLFSRPLFFCSDTPFCDARAQVRARPRTTHPPQIISISRFFAPIAVGQERRRHFFEKRSLGQSVCARRFKPPPPPLSFSFFWQTAPECVCARVSLSVFFCLNAPLFFVCPRCAV